MPRAPELATRGRNRTLIDATVAAFQSSLAAGGGLAVDAGMP